MIEALPVVRARYVGRASALRVGPAERERFAVVTTALAVAFLPLLSPSGPANIAPVDALIALALAATGLWTATSRHLWRFPYGLPAVLFLAGGVLGALVGPVPGKSLVAVAQDLVLLLWCWAIVNLGSTPPRLKLLLATWAYSSIAWVSLLFVGLAAGSTALTGRSAREGSRTALTLIDPNVSANYYVLSLMIIWAARRPRRRAARLAAYGLLLAAIATTGSNSGVVSLVVACAVASITGIYRRRGAAPAVAALAAVVLAGYFTISNVSVKDVTTRAHNSRYSFIRDGVGRGEVSADQRGMLLHETIPLYLTGGPLGQGPVSTKPRLERDLAPFVKEAHDDYLAALVERGPVGFVGLFLLVCALVVRAKSLAAARLDPAWAAVVVRPNALVGAVAATLVAGTVYELLHVRHVWTLFAFLAAIFAWGRS